MTFRQLQAFLYVVRLGTIVAAAETMGLTQSGVSRLIGELERNLGFSLFSRVGRGLEPTARGLAFFKEVERSFSGIDTLYQAAEEIRTGYEHRLRISCLPTLSTSVMSGAVKLFREKYPKVVLEIDTATFSESLVALEQRRIDLAVTFTVPTMDGVRTERLAEAEYVFAARSEHPLMARNIVNAEELVGEEVIGLISDHGQPKDEVEEERSEIEEQAQRRLWCHTSSTRYAFVAAGLAVSIAEPFAAPLFAHAGVAIRRFRPRLDLHYCFAIPSAEQRSQTSLFFRAQFRSAMKSFIEDHALPARVF